MARREFYGKGYGRKEKNVFDIGPQTKIDALVRIHTGYNSLSQMAKNYPTLRAPPGSSNKTKKEFAQLRKAYKLVTGKDAFK